MNMRIIPCEVNDEYVIGAGVVIGAKGSHNDVALRLVFSDKWYGLAKSITWKDARGENSALTVITEQLKDSEYGYIVPIPSVAKVYSGEIKMTVRGVETSGDEVSAIAMSATAYFTVLESDFDAEAIEQIKIDASVTEQLLADAAATRAIAENLQTRADNGEFNGADGEKGEKGDKGAPGEKGADGAKGEDGKTPVKGVDYFTDEDARAFFDKYYWWGEDKLQPRFGSIVSFNTEDDFEAWKDTVYEDDIYGGAGNILVFVGGVLKYYFDVWNGDYMPLVTEADVKIGNIESALDEIIALENDFINGGAV